MSTSTIKIYKNTKINPRKNFKVDDLSTYLSSFTPISLSNFQYIKHSLNLSIKIDKDQFYLETLITYDYDYCSIQNSDSTKVMYYFIVDKKWRSKSCVELVLVMDTINTFVLGTDYKLDDKTLVNRQHQDRFIKPSQDFGGVPANQYDIEELPEYSEQEFCVKVKEGEVTFESGIIDANSVGGEFKMVKRYKYLNNEITSTEYIDYIEFTSSTMKLYNAGTLITSFSVADISSGPYLITIIFYDAGELEAVITGEPLENFGIFIPRMIRNIHLSSEGISPVLYGTEKGLVRGDDHDWYLIYAGTTMRCYLTNDVGFTTTIDGDSQILPSDLTLGRYYYLIAEENYNHVGITGTDSDGNTLNLDIDHWYGGTGGMTWEKREVLVYWLSGGSIKAQVMLYMNLGIGYFYVSSSPEYTLVSLDFLAEGNLGGYFLSSKTNNVATIKTGTPFSITLVTSSVDVRGFNQLDRFNSNLYKIIKLPYCPVDSFTGWNFDDVDPDNSLFMLYLDNVDTLFSKKLSSTYKPMEELFGTPDRRSDERDIEAESKLFHSDYYQPKFIYDSFSFTFNLELVNVNYIDTADYAALHLATPVVFNMTNTINSRFMFTFTSYVTDEKSLSDFDSVLVVARNNEVSIFTSDYINYLRNGYNYEVKNKNREIGFQWGQLGINAATSAATYAIGGGGLSSGLSLSGSLTNQIMGAVKTTIASEQALQQKVFQLSRQHASVRGSDDVDLMSLYTGNKAKYMLYKVSDKMRKVLSDLFFYTGYIDGTMHTPNVTSRTRFNFVSCEAVIDNLANIPEEVIEDMINKYSVGVTFIHHYKNSWDFEQENENWEVSLYE